MRKEAVNEYVQEQDDYSQIWINDYATRSLRDVADKDYISARMNHRANLREPFLGSSHQALEKYLKAILLFNGEDTRKIGHDLIKGLNQIKSIHDLSFSLPDEVDKFIEYINDYGSDRYLQYASYLKPHALLLLDRSVWHIRKYCSYMRVEINKPDGTTVNALPFRLNKISSALYQTHPHKFKIEDGYLEAVIRKKDDAYDYLTRHNPYFGFRRKKRIKSKGQLSFTNATLALHPEAFSVLCKYVKFSKDVENHFKEKRTGHT